MNEEELLREFGYELDEVESWDVSDFDELEFDEGGYYE